MKFWVENWSKDNLDGCLGLNEGFCISSEDKKIVEKHKQYKYWTLEEDEMLSKISKDLNYDWNKVSEMFPARTLADIEQRWRKRIDPVIKILPWTKDEDQILLLMYKKFGGKWKMISKYLPGRLPSSIKHRFYCKINEKDNKNSLISDQEPNLLDEVDDELYIESHLDLSFNQTMNLINDQLASQYNLRLVTE